MKTLHKLLLAIGLIGTVSTANAIPVDWTLTSTGSSSSQIWVSGTFTFDADTGIFSNNNLIFSYISSGTTAYGSFVIKSGSSTSLNLSTNGAVVSLTFNPLTNAGGVVSLNSGQWSTKLTDLSFTTLGTLTGVPQATAATAVPEPEQYALMLAGLGLVGFAARRKTA